MIKKFLPFLILINLMGTTFADINSNNSSAFTVSGQNAYKTTGNVGIGTAAPAYKLHVKGNLNIDGSIYQNGSVFSGGGGSGITGLTVGKLPKASSATTIIDSAIYENGGNVGIGTTVPSALFAVGSTSQFKIDSSGVITTTGSLSTFPTIIVTSKITAASIGTNGYGAFTIQNFGSSDSTAGRTYVNIFGGGATNTATSGTTVITSITPTYNQTGTTANTDLLINRTETAVGSGRQRLIDAQVGGTSKFAVETDGGIYINAVKAKVSGTCTSNIVVANGHIMSCL